MPVVLFFLFLLLLPFGWHVLLRRIDDSATKKRLAYAGTTLFTLSYWAWETRVPGNIRVDLLLIYPVLFSCYIIAFWSMMKWKALFPALVLMALNCGFVVLSYSLFGKYPG